MELAMPYRVQSGVDSGKLFPIVYI